MSTISTDVCVLGAGPGGAAASLFLSKLGIAHVLVDKAAFPRDKICGDALSGKVVEVLNKYDPAIVEQLVLEPTQLGSWGVTFVAPNRKGLRIPFRQQFDKNKDRAPGYIAKRLDFDHFLLKKALANKQVDFLAETALTQFEEQADYIVCRDEKKGTEIHTKLLIVADGAQSVFARKHAGIEMEPAHYCAGVRAYYSGVSGLDADNFIELHFLKELLPGYFWIFPLPNGGANVGLGIRSDEVSRKRINLKQELAAVIESQPQIKARFANARLEGDIKGFGLPLGSKKRKISGSRYMLVGDAASLIDPFTGEGIGNALMSGMLAAAHASHCLKHNNYSTAFMQAYDTSVYARLWSELSLSRKMQQLVKRPWLFNLVVNRAEKNKTLREIISCMFDDIDLRKRLKQPSFYVNLLLSGNR